jgi:putative ABC transport system permease protein
MDDPGDAILSQKSPINLVINETAARQLGFPSPQAAIGRVLHVMNLSPPIVIVGVVKDFSIPTPERKIDATGYAYFMQDYLLHVKLKSDTVPATLAAIDKAWDRTGATGPIQLTFMNAYVENLHLALLRQGQAAAVFAGVAVLLACLGLFGLSLSTAERRTKEIGIRKALGASSTDVLALLLWEFAKPVLWANLIAWPLAWWLMSQWLSGFAYHVSLSLWPFLAAAAGELIIALLTVAGQSWLTARQKPVLALRYE